jgi:cobalt-zinc-cadmium resistance protein CzcA
MPAALSTGIGSETQKPLAVVVICGLVSATILTLITLPAIYYMWYKNSPQRIASETDEKDFEDFEG